MSDRKPADNHDPITMEIDREFERELSEMFHRTVPPIPVFNFEPTARVIEHRSLLRRTPILVRVAVSLAAVVTLVTFAVIWQPSEAGANVSFAEVQESVKSTKTLTYRETTITNGSDSREEQTETEEISLLAPSTVRFDKANGAYSLLDIGERRTLYVDPEKQQVTLFEGMGQITAEMQKMNLYDFFRGIQARAVSNLPAKTLDGKQCPGFLVKHEVEHPWSEESLAIELSVWVDPNNKLPVRIEEHRRYKEDGQEISVQVVRDQFVFDAPLDPKLFSFDPPEGYQVQSYGTAKLSPPHEDDEIQKPVLTPNVGLGPVKFGMLADEVKKLLGEPDKENPIGENGVGLDYNSRGYGIQVSNVLGVWLISASSGTFSITQIREFAGQTDKGLGLGASEEDVRKAYGEPSSVEDDTDQGGYKTLYYNDLNGWFSFWRGKLDSMTFNIPRETKLKMFELRKPDPQPE